ncbi:MAG: glycosyltransferase 61 family protein [Lachnospiraceae bacterium]
MKANYDLSYIDAINRQAYQQQVNHNYYEVRPLSIEKIEGGIVLPYQEGISSETAGGGVVDRSGNYIEISAQRIVGTEMNDKYEYEKYATSDETVVWFGAFYAHWGHFLTEMVARCWYFQHMQENINTIKVAYISKPNSAGQSMHGNYLEFLELLGINKENIIEVVEPTRFKQVIVPELSCRGGGYYTKEYIEIFDTISAHVKEQPSNNSKLYFTRLKSKYLRGTELGEKSIKHLFQKNQYKVIAPEHCSLREQIAYIKNCDDMVVMSGTLPHNILFARDGIHVTIINRTGEVNSYQALINQSRNADVTYIDAHLSLFPVFAGGPFLLYMSENLLTYAKDRQMKLLRKKKNIIGMHIKLTWYFFAYLDNMTATGIKRWKLDEKFGMYIMNTYAFYRNRIPEYDKKAVCRLRKCFYILARMFE